MKRTHKRIIKINREQNILICSVLCFYKVIKVLLYKFPKKLSASEQIEQAGERMKINKKIRKLRIQNIILLAVIIILLWRVPVIWLKLLTAFILLIYIAFNSLIIMSVRRQEDSGAYTKIYDDRIEHKQANLFNLKKTNYREVTVFYNDIKSSYQDAFGNMQFRLIGGEIVSLYFCDTDAKLYLINNLYDKIKYPKKVYRDLSSDETTDKDDPDYSWKNWKDI